MRRLVSLALAGGLVWWLVGRRRRGSARRTATIGYADGSAVTLTAGSPELERLLLAAAEATTS